jgi:hypothetical protein
MLAPGEQLCNCRMHSNLAASMLYACAAADNLAHDALRLLQLMCGSSTHLHACMSLLRLLFCRGLCRLCGCSCWADVHAAVMSCVQSRRCSSCWRCRQVGKLGALLINVAVAVGGSVTWLDCYVEYMQCIGRCSTNSAVHRNSMAMMRSSMVQQKQVSNLPSLALFANL